MFDRAVSPEEHEYEEEQETEDRIMDAAVLAVHLGKIGDSP